MARPQLSIEVALAAADPQLGRVIAAVVARIGLRRIKPSGAAPFQALVRATLHQGVSGKSAALSFARLTDLVENALTPGRILALPEGAARAAGLSRSKFRTLLNLAEWFSVNPSTAEILPGLPDEAVAVALTGISGIGLWTVNVFLIFDLGRPDVMPASDGGIRRGVQLVCGLPRSATASQVRERAQLWRPHRSLASVYLWNAAKLQLPTLRREA